MKLMKRDIAPLLFFVTRTCAAYQNQLEASSIQCTNQLQLTLSTFNPSDAPHGILMLLQRLNTLRGNSFGSMAFGTTT